jgi:hypothetical protein
MSGMTRRLLILGFLGIGATVMAEPVPMVAEGGPLTVVQHKVEVSVGREMSMVSERYMLQYVERDDTDPQQRLRFIYPLYVEKGLRNNREDILAASVVALEVGGQSLAPIDAQLVVPEALSDYPVPEDAAVAQLTFAIPRDLARLRFEVTITHLQPNFHYKGVWLAAFTPWYPKAIHIPQPLAPDEVDFSVTLKALAGVSLKKFSAVGRILRETPTELSVASEHRQTVAVEIGAAPAK